MAGVCIISDGCVEAADLGSGDCMYIRSIVLAALTYVVADRLGVGNGDKRGTSADGVEVDDIAISEDLLRGIWGFLPKSELSNCLI